MSEKKPALGRGLADLLGQVAGARQCLRCAPIAPAADRTGCSDAVAAAARVTRGGDELAHLPRGRSSTRGKYQPRVDMRQEALEELAISIRNQGVIQPIVVRPLADRRSRARSATKSSPANAAGAPRRSRASPPFPPSSAACPMRPRSRWR